MREKSTPVSNVMLRHCGANVSLWLTQIQWQGPYESGFMQLMIWMIRLDLRSFSFKMILALYLLLLLPFYFLTPLLSTMTPSTTPHWMGPNQNEPILTHNWQAKQLTTENLQERLFELEQATAVASIEARSYIQVGFLSQLLVDFCVVAVADTEVSSAGSAEVANTNARFDALGYLLKLVAHQSDFATVICTSLQSALSQQSKLNNSNLDPFLLSLLKLLLTTRKKSAKAKHNGLDKLSTSTFAISIYSGWKLFNLDSNSKSYSFLQKYLELLLELNQLVEVTPAVKQVILCTFSSKVRKMIDSKMKLSAYFIKICSFCIVYWLFIYPSVSITICSPSIH